MSSQAPPPASGAQTTGPSSQPLAEAVRTSSRDPATGESGAGLIGGQSGVTTDALGVPSNGPSGAANDASDNVERSSKRSLTGRRRDGSTGSKRSNRQAAATNEKIAQPGSSSGVQTTTQPKPKKKGFLSFLTCCSAPDDSQELGSSESAQPTKTPAAKLQPTRAKPPPQSAQAQNASATNTSADASKEVIDEKAGQNSVPNSTSVAAPVLPTPPSESEKPAQPQAVIAPGNPGSNVPAGATAVSTNSEARPLETERQPTQTEHPTPGPAHLDTSQKALVEPSVGSGNPQVNVTAPTPVVPQQDEGDAMILDRTPEQAQRDTDIEMTDNGPSLPLSTADVAAPESEKHGHERRESDSSSRVIDLPPPPPLAERQAQVSHTAAAGAGVAGAGVLAAGAATAATHASSERTSLVSTPEQNQRWLLPAIKPEMKGRKCLVLDLDETLVHSSFKILHQADFTIPVEIEGQYHNVYVIKRPGVDAFLKRVGEIYEVVVFTASVSKYGDPLLDQLDISNSVHHRLFRESCYNHQGNYVKDLSQVGRPLEETIIIDNSPTSYIFHPQHAVPISSWFSDAHDNELPDLIPFLEDLAGDKVRDVSVILDVAL